MTTKHWLKSQLVHTCTVRRDSGTAQSSSGQVTPSWANQYTSQPCRYVERTERVASENFGAVMLFEHQLLLNGTADVTAADRIAYLRDPDGDAMAAGTFTVEQVVKRRDIDGKVSHLSLRLERVAAS